jgi:hypothetical protein
MQLQERKRQGDKKLDDLWKQLCEKHVNQAVKFKVSILPSHLYYLLPSLLGILLILCICLFSIHLALSLPIAIGGGSLLVFGILAAVGGRFHLTVESNTGSYKILVQNRYGDQLSDSWISISELIALFPYLQIDKVQGALLRAVDKINKEERQQLARIEQAIEILQGEEKSAVARLNQEIALLEDKKKKETEELNQIRKELEHFGIKTLG